jgi:hypothetical protein
MREMAAKMVEHRGDLGNWTVWLLRLCLRLRLSDYMLEGTKLWLVVVECRCC